ncbi:LysE family transporter [Nocardia sp. NPDC058176]|uniref:LysE family transporter n=1 Tax=Nocardia sp. NPDC058176 TaxID=3346368 RepID=UPI0036DEE8A8
MPSLPILFAFIGASLAMNLTPGLDTMFVLAQTSHGGARGGCRAVLGIATGSAFHTVLAAVGITALVATSPASLTALTYAGGAKGFATVVSRIAGVVLIALAVGVALSR